MSERRKCVNCRHNIRIEKLNGNIECKCEITNKHIGYVDCFEHWCRHWAKDNKLFVCPDQPEELEAKATDLENTELAKSFEKELREHNQNKYNKWQMSKLQVKIDGEWQDLAKVEDLSWERTYAKEPTREIGVIEGKVDIDEQPIPKCFVANDEIEKKHEAYIDIISDTTFAFIIDACMNLLYTAKNIHCVGENDRIYYEWNYETLERNVPLPHDDRPCYEKGRVTLRYTIVRADNKAEIFDRNFKRLTSGEFGNPAKFETMVAYWKAQAEAGYPCAEENVRYFEDMVRKK